MVADIDRGNFVLPDRTPLAHYLVGWLEARWHELRPSTVHGYRAVIVRYVAPSIGEVQLKDVRAGHLNRLYAGMVARGLSPRTTRTVHTVVHRALRDAVRDGVMARNPADAASLPHVHATEMKTWTADHLRAFLAHAHVNATPATFAALYVAAATGMRRGEVVGLRWGDIDFDAEHLTVTRTRVSIGGRVVEGPPTTTRGRRVVVLDPSTVAVLRSWRSAQAGTDLDRVRRDAIVFPGDPDQLSEDFLRLVRDVKVPRIRLHDLRHTAATLQLAAGVPLHVVSARLGHSNATTTLNTYAHVLPGQQAAAAEAMARFLSDG